MSQHVQDGVNGLSDGRKGGVALFLFKEANPLKLCPQKLHVMSVLLEDLHGLGVMALGLGLFPFEGRCAAGTGATL